MNLGNLFAGPDMASRLMPEWIMILGIIAMLVVPNIGNAHSDCQFQGSHGASPTSLVASVLL